MKPNGGGADRRPGCCHRRQVGFARAPFQGRLQASAVGNLGSGWTWLVRGRRFGQHGKRRHAGTPLDHRRQGPALREHLGTRLYIDYRNLRPKFVETFLASLVNWSFAEANFA